MDSKKVNKINNVVKVKIHNRKTKQGKLSTVKEHNRKNKIEHHVDGGNEKIIQGIKKLRNLVLKESVDTAIKLKNSTINENVYNDLEKKLKAQVVKFVITNYGYNKNDMSDIKHKSDSIFNNLQSIMKNVFHSKRLNIKFLPAKKRNNVVVSSNEPSKFKYYFGSGENVNVDSLIKSPSSLREGDVFYSQKISNNEPWKETAKRKDLRIIQLGTKDDKGLFNVSFMTFKNSKPVEVSKKLDNEKVFMFIKEGKKNE